MKKGAVILFSLFFYSLMILYSALTIPLLTLAVVAGAPFVSRPETMRRFRRMIARYGYVLIKVLARPAVRIVYEAPAHATQGSKIFVANHVSSSDPFLMALLPETVVQVVNLWPFKLPVWGLFARWAGYLNIRALSAEDFQERATRLLHEGTSIVAFPEGTRAGDQPMGPFHGALFRLALTTRTPLVPLCIHGNARTPARGSILLYPTTIQVRRLPEIPWETFREQTPFQLKTRVHQQMQHEVNRMRSCL